MAKVYSKFLSLTSGISLEDVQVNAGTEVELVTIFVPYGQEEALTLRLNKPLTSSEFLNDRPFLPVISLESGVDFDIDQADQDTFRITFSKPISEFGFPYRETETGVEYALWATDCTVDEGLIYSQYAKTLKISPDSSTNIYKDYVRGLYFLFTQGPNLAYMEQGINLSLGIPVARTNEVVFLTTFDPQQGTWVIVTNKNSYVLPYGIEPSISRGSVLTQGEALANVVTIEDFTSDGAWWLNIYIPQSILPEGVPEINKAVGNVASPGSVVFDLMSKYLKTHTFLVKVTLSPGAATGNFDTLRTLINQVKPSYTLGIYVWEIPLGTEDVDLEETVTVQPTVIKDSFLGVPAFHDRTIFSVYPDGQPKTTRGTDKWFIRSNYSSDARNIFNSKTDRVQAPLHVVPSDYLNLPGPQIDSTKVAIHSRFQTFLSDGVQTTFHLEFTPLSQRTVHVYVNGVYHTKDSFYVYENLLVLRGAVPTGSNIDVVCLHAPNLVTKQVTFSGDGQSTVYALPSSTTDKSHVLLFENGIAINHLKYRLQNSSLILDIPLVEGTNNIDIIIYESEDPNTPLLYVFSGDDIQNRFFLGDANENNKNLTIFINGVYQEKSKFQVSEGVVEFVDPPVSGSNNIEILNTYLMANQAGLVTARKDSFSGEVNRYDFKLSYVPLSKNSLQVFIGGIRQYNTSFELGGPSEDIVLFDEPPPIGDGNVEVSYLVGEGVTFDYALFPGDGVTESFTTDFDIVDPFGISVYIDGVYQISTSYQRFNNMFTFSEPIPANNTVVEIVHLSSPNFQAHIAGFTTDGMNKVFDTGILDVQPQYVDVYFQGIYQNQASYTYNNGVVTFYEAPYAAINSVEVITSNYEGEITDVVGTTPMYNLTTQELKDKLAAAGIPAPNLLPNRFALAGYMPSAALDTRSGALLAVNQGETYYSPVSNTYTENLLKVDSNGQKPETHLSYAFRSDVTGLLLVQRCSERSDLWSVFGLGSLYKTFAFAVPEEDPLSIFFVPA